MMRPNKPAETIAAAVMIATMSVFAAGVQAQNFTFTKIADSSTPMPGGSDNFTFFTSVSLHGENVVFRGANSNFSQGGIYAKFGDGALSLIANRSTAIPGGNGNFSGFENPSISGTNIAFWASSSLGGCSTFGIFSKFGANPLAVVSNTCTAIPSSSGTFSHFGTGPSVSGTSVSFMGQLCDGGCNASNQKIGVYTTVGGLRRVADRTTSIPGGTGAFNPGHLDVFGQPILAGMDTIFRGEGTGNQEGFYHFDGDSSFLSVIVDKNAMVPGTASNFADFRNDGYDFDGTHLTLIDMEQELLFTPPTRTGIYAANVTTGQITVVADLDTMIPGSTETFEGLSASPWTPFVASAVSGDNVLFNAFGSGNTTTLYLHDMVAQTLSRVIGSGDTLDGKTINQLFIKTTGGAIMDGDRFAFPVWFTDDSRAVYVGQMIPPSCDPDEEDPTIDCQKSVMVNADAGACEATGVTLPEPAVSDNCGIESVTNDAPEIFPIGDTVVTWTATDTSDNTADCLMTVTVVDNQSPVISDCPEDIVVTAPLGSCEVAVDWAEPTADDNCGIDTFTSTHDPEDIFPVGTTIVTYTAEDENGNIAICTFSVTVLDEEEPEILGCPEDIMSEADADTCEAVVNWTEPTADDNCGVDSFLTTHMPGDSFPLGTTTVTYTAEDESGNMDTCSFSITVVDDEAPAITTCPPDRMIPADGDCQAVVPNVTGEANLSDACDASPTVSQSPQAGTIIGLGDTTVTVTAEDAAGNSSECMLTITVTENGCNDDDGDDGDNGDDSGAPVDGNNDGIPDDEQDHVASVQNVNGDFVTVVSPQGTTLVNVQSGDNPSPDDAPEGVDFPAGFISFTVQGVAPGAAVEVQLILHVSEGTAINNFYKHGPTPDDPTPHWYEFLFDGTTGVTSISGNVITMTLVDGQRGDADLTANGTIVDPGAPAFLQPGGPFPSPDACGLCASGAMASVAVLMLGMMMLRVLRRPRKKRLGRR